MVAHELEITIASLRMSKTSSVCPQFSAEIHLTDSLSPCLTDVPVTSHWDVMITRRCDACETSQAPSVLCGSFYHHSIPVLPEWWRKCVASEATNVAVNYIFFVSLFKFFVFYRSKKPGNLVEYLVTESHIKQWHFIFLFYSDWLYCQLKLFFFFSLITVLFIFVLSPT